MATQAVLDASVLITQTLVSQGWATQGIATVQGNYTPLASDAVVLVNASGGPVTITLADFTQPPYVAGQRYTIIKTDSSGNAVTVQGTGGQTVAGSAVALTTASACTSVVADANSVAWYIWAGLATISGPPSGPAGGDLNGSYPNPGVAKVNGVTISGTPAWGLSPVASTNLLASWSVPGAPPSGDPSGATDLANINANIAAGGPLFLQAGGTYYINGPMTALPSNFEFAGGHGGRGTTAAPTVVKGVAGYSSSTAPVNFVSGSSEQEIRDVSFDGTAMAAGTCVAIEANTASPVNYVKLRRLLIAGAGFSNGVHLLNVGGNLIGWMANQVTVRSANSTGILLSGATDGDWFLVQSASCGVHGWSIQGCQNSRFTGCKANQNTQNGFSISGVAWGTGTGSGGANFTGCTTDRNIQSGVNVSSTGTGPMVFSGCMFRRDGSDGNATRAGLLVASGCTNPVVVDGIGVFPGVNDDGSGNNGPALGISVANTSAPVLVGTGYVQGATTAISNGGANPGLYVAPGVVEATGTTAAPVISANAPATSVITKPTAPASTTSATLVMMGLGTSATGTPAAITPTGTGRVQVTVTAQVTTATGAAVITYGGRFGTGTAPSNGTAVTGTRFGSAGDPTTTPNAASVRVPISFTDIVTLSVGTAAWFDLALATANASDAASVNNVSISLVELTQ